MGLNSGKPTAAPRPRLVTALAALGVVYGDTSCEDTTSAIILIAVAGRRSGAAS